MAKNIRISDDLCALAQNEAKLQERSIAQQIEHWAKRGLVGDDQGVTALRAAVAFSHELDKLDVQSGRRNQESMLLISRRRARQSKYTFPAKYTP